MILTDESRAKAAETRARNAAAQAATEAETKAAKAAEQADAEREFPKRCSVKINAPGDTARHGKVGHVVRWNEGEAEVRFSKNGPIVGYRRSELSRPPKA